MNRVGGDEVKPLARGRDEVARVIVHDFDPWIAQYVVILEAEVRCHHARDQRLDIADHDPRDRRM